MEPQETKQLALPKAISAHDEAVSALADLTTGELDPRYVAMLDRVKQNLSDLHEMAQRADPSDTV